MTATAYKIRGRNAGLRWIRRIVVSADKAGRAPMFLLLAHQCLPRGPASLFKRLVMRIYCIDAALDPAWYLSNNPDVAANGIDPAFHYLATGWRENRRPSPYVVVLDQTSPPPLMLNPISRAAFFPEEGVLFFQDPPFDGGHSETNSAMALSPEPILSSSGPTGIEIGPTLDPGAPINQLAPPVSEQVPVHAGRVRLLIVDPPSIDGFECAQWIFECSGSDATGFFIYLAGEDGLLRIAKAIDAEPVHSFQRPAEMLAAVAFIRSHEVESVDIIYGADARLDLDLLLDCLSHSFTLTLTDYALLAPDGTLHELRTDGAFPLRARRFAARAETIRCANRAMMLRIQSAAPRLPIEFWPVAKDVFDRRQPVLTAVPLQTTEHRILVLGNLTDARGRRVVIDAAKIIVARGLSLVVTVLGEIDPPLSVEEQRGAAIIMTGPCDWSDLDTLIRAIAPRLIWVPAGACAPPQFAMRGIVCSGIPALASDTPVLLEEFQDQEQVSFCSSTLDAGVWVDGILSFMAAGHVERAAKPSGQFSDEAFSRRRPTGAAFKP